MVGVKKDQFYSQKSISEIIALNESEYELEIKGKTDGVYSYSASTLLSAFYWYQKISFALLSGFFGDSKIERALAISNKKRLEKLISKIYHNALKTDFELWHSLIHSIHDILDSHRKLSKEQEVKIWKY